MSFLTYTQGIPNATNNPSNDQPIMKVNNDSNFSIWPIDHYGFEDNRGGKHKYIRIPTNNAPAGNTGLQEIVLANAAGGFGPGGFQLHYVAPNTTVAGNLIQLTRNEKPVSTGQGYSWIAGGILIQWGIVNNTSALTGTVPFQTNFAVPAFSVVLTYYTASVPKRINLIAGTVANNQFSWICNDGAAADSFYWMAIGR